MKIEKGKRLTCIKELVIKKPNKTEIYSTILKDAEIEISSITTDGVYLGYSEIPISFALIKKHFKNTIEVIDNDYTVRVFKDDKLPMEIEVLKSGLLNRVDLYDMKLTSNLDLKRKGLNLLTISIFIKDSEIDIIGV